jgi:CheY-like chemotaxis protein
MYREARLPRWGMAADSDVDCRCLMVVDDDRDLVDALCELIGLCSDWTTHGAYGPGDAIAQASKNAPDAILLDMEMDGVDGFDTATRLSTLAGQSHPTLIALTGNYLLRDVASHDSRFTASILKPADLTELLNLLQKVSLAR